MDGDDIGLEIVPEAVRVLQAAIAREAGLEVAFRPFPVGWSSYLEHGHTLPRQTLDGLERMHGLILGPIGHAAYPKDRAECVNPHPIIRRHFDLFANLRPARSYPAVEALHRDVDLLVVRENNEGFQPDRNMLAGCGEFQPNEHNAFSIRVISRQQSRRIAREAFEAARRRDGMRRVTAIHKRTVFKLTDGLFMDTVQEVAKDYPDVALDDYQVDSAALHLVMRPQRFDVVLCSNMFGDILSDLTAGLVGGLGMAPGLNAGDDQAMAQATHGSAPDISGKGLANPYAMIMSGTMLLDWLGARHGDDRLASAARRVQAAVESVIAQRTRVTRDLGGDASTRQMGAAIAEACGVVPQ
ncbi:MAG: isocitrate/isopropylmalate dehydrogenase family protein [Streptosporangiales bacterium]|nr:isocitrate/isopropylmalate dehydrogenase family protein [Streptosporangiales bacterium]